MQRVPSSPRIFLAIDNCFASRRWTAPADWAREIAGMGLTYVEASADNECDPLYMTPEYLADWVSEVQAAQDQFGVRVANLYSGHGTYTTTGLGHHDDRIRDRILHEWLKPMAGLAGGLGAGLGFACHGFSEATLNDPTQFETAEADLYDRLADLAAYAREVGAQPIGTEQMYYPHVVPWTIAGAGKLLREVYARGGRPMYLTIDTGHMYGQRRYMRPTAERIAEVMQTGAAGVWLGPRSAHAMMTEGDVSAVEAEMDRYPYLFATERDSDPYAWLEQLACYSPIIHLQQTEGKASAHLPFTGRWNATGIIHPRRILEAIACSYVAPEAPGMPPRCDALYLTLEVFSGRAEFALDILAALEESAAYWRQWVPRDGLTLDELLA